MSVRVIKTKEEFDKLVHSGKVILIDFWATWCGPCKMISPKFEELAKSEAREGSVEFYKVDVDEAPEVAQEAGIKAMPTFQIYKDGARVDELVGAVPAKLQALVQAGVARA